MKKSLNDFVKRPRWKDYIQNGKINPLSIHQKNKADEFLYTLVEAYYNGKCEVDISLSGYQVFFTFSNNLKYGIWIGNYPDYYGYVSTINEDFIESNTKDIQVPGLYTRVLFKRFIDSIKGERELKVLKIEYHLDILKKHLNGLDQEEKNNV